MRLVSRACAVVLLLAATPACLDDAAPPYLRVSGPAPALEDVPRTRAHLVVFWASWCAPCREEAPELRALAARPPEGLSVVVFSQDPSLEDVTKFLGGPPEQALNLRLDTREGAGRAFGVEKLPTSFLVVAGQRVARFDGPRKWASAGMRKQLERLIASAGRAAPN